jgi:hypothetical protein
MPVLTTPYSLAGDVTKLIRAAINDMGTSSGVAGNLFSDTQPYTFILLQSAYRELFAVLRKNGWETAKAEIILSTVPLVTSPDPGIQVLVSFTGSNNGTNNFANPFLPPDLIIPTRLWERQTGSLSQFCPMDLVMDSLPSLQQGSSLRYWQWRQNDGLYFCGATQNVDVRMQYASLPNILTLVADPVMIIGGENALAYMTAGLFGFARGSAQSEACLNLADRFIGDLLAPVMQQKQRVNYRRRPYGSGCWTR